MSIVGEVHAHPETASPRRHGYLSRIALRQRTQDHPMAMFFLIVVTAFVAAALISPSAAALASLGARDLPSSTGAGIAIEVDAACRGQAWGAESAACLAEIARKAGRGDNVTIRPIVAQGPR